MMGLTRPPVIRPLPTLLIGVLLALPAPALVIDSLAANSTPPADDPGFDNVGRRNVSTGVYLGYGWVITAKHVPLGDVIFDGVTHTFVPGSEIAIAHDASNDADLRIFQITPWPDLPPLRIRSDPLPDPATNTTDVVMIGFGAHAGDPISVFPPPTQDDGYLWSTAGKSIRWGTNVIESLEFVSSANTQSFTTEFDQGLPTPHECQVANGDSGGAVFVKNAGVWELAGIMYARTGSVPSAAIYADKTFAADLSHPDYRDQIVSVVFPAQRRPTAEDAHRLDVGAGRVAAPRSTPARP